MKKLLKILLILNISVFFLVLQVERPTWADENISLDINQKNTEMQRRMLKIRKELEEKKANINSKAQIVRQDVEKKKQEIKRRIAELKDQSFEELPSSFDLIDQGLEFRFDDISFSESNFEKQFRPVKTIETTEEAILKIHNVLVDLAYDEQTASTLAKEFLPLYERLYFSDTKNTQAIINDLEKNRRIIHSYVFNLEGGIDPKQFNIVVLLTDGEHSGFMRDVVHQFDTLTEKQKLDIHAVFLCNYTSYLGWIMLKAKGLNPQAILTDNVPTELKQQTRPWWEQLTKNYHLQEPPENIYHAALTLELPNSQDIFVDFVNNYLSQPYILKEDYYHSILGWHTLLNYSRKDILERFDIVDHSNFKAVLYDMIGNVHYDFGRYELSIECSKAALKISPTLFLPHLNLGLKYNDLKNHSLAVEHFKKAIELNPYALLVHQSMGYSYYELKQYKNAIDELNSYLKASTQIDSNIYVILAGCYFNLHQFEMAANNFQKAIEMNSEDAEAHYFLGLSYLELGQDSLAKKSLKKALKILITQNNVDRILSIKQILNERLKFTF